MKQFQTFRFTSDDSGQARKNVVLTYLTQHGWRITGEVIEPGHMKGGEACCFASMCLPMGFAAGRTPNVTILTVERDSTTPANHRHSWQFFDVNYTVCPGCQTIQPFP